MLRRRVIIPTASADNGTGDPIPISFPVSRGSGCEEDEVEVPVVGGTTELVGLESAVLVPTRWGGTTGGARSSDGDVSIPPFPRVGPCIQSNSTCLNNGQNVPKFLSRSKRGH
jgi:hypothetical protein